MLPLVRLLIVLAAGWLALPAAETGGADAPFSAVLGAVRVILFYGGLLGAVVGLALLVQAALVRRRLAGQPVDPEPASTASAAHIDDVDADEGDAPSDVVNRNSPRALALNGAILIALGVLIAFVGPRLI